MGDPAGENECNAEKINNDWKLSEFEKRNLHIQEVKQTLNWINWKKLMPGYIIIKSLKKKDKEKSWKPPETNDVLLDVNSKTILVTACFSLKIMNSRKKHFSSAERKKSCHPEFYI